MARTPKVIAPQSQALGKRKLRRGLGNRIRPTAKDDAAEVARKQRREEVARLRLTHSLPYGAIGKELGITPGMAHEDFQKWKAEQPPSPLAEGVRAEEEPKLQRNAGRIEITLQLLARHKASEKLGLIELLTIADREAKLIEKATKVSESRRRLHGADAPEVKEHRGTGGGPIQVAASAMTPSELLALVAQNRQAE
jgi:hypothetical protein